MSRLNGRPRAPVGSMQPAGPPPAAVVVGLVGLGVASTAITFVAAFGATVDWWAPIPRVAWAPPVVPVAVVRSLTYLALTVGAVMVRVRRHETAVRSALVLFVVQQAVATVWPVVFFAGYSWTGRGGLWLTVGLLLVLDLLLAATTAAFWAVSRRAGVLAALDLGLTLFVTALIVGSAGQHAVL